MAAPQDEVVFSADGDCTGPLPGWMVKPRHAETGKSSEPRVLPLAQVDQIFANRIQLFLRAGLRVQ
jgi:hypothetical protein